MNPFRGRLLRAAAVILPVAAAAGWYLAPMSAHASSQVAVWQMNEGAGATTMVDSAGGHDGAVKNAQTGVPGFSGNAYRFNGSSSVVVVPASPAFNPGSADWSFTVHVNFTKPPNATVGDYDLFRGPSQGAYKAEILARKNRTQGVASCFFKGSSTKATLTAGPNLADGRWHTITCTKHASNIQLVVDGTTFTRTVTIGTLTNTGPVSLGAKAKGGDWYDGLLDEVSVTSG
ncbi:MAG TPA: LamG-like jellyroll fold domain-containing protein [Actinomycetota bacterium]